MFIRRLTCAGAVALLAAAIVATSAPAQDAGSCPLPKFGPGSEYHPAIDPTRFSARVDNPLFGLTPGTKFYVRGVGEVQERAVRGPREQLDLVEVLN